MKRYVIIGNGVAAVNCIEGIREKDGKGKITVISEEKHEVYCRPLISYYLDGKTDLKRIGYRDADFPKLMGCDILYGKNAVRIDEKARKVYMDDGEALPYDALCVATGSSPFVPDIKGLEKVEKKFCFTTLDDALKLEKAIDEKTRVLIIGAGMIGLKCAEGIRGRVSAVTVCDMADRILPTFLDAECAAYLQRRLEEHGISFILKDSVEEFSSGRALLRSGSSAEFDVLVLAVGSRANASLVRDIGGKCERGIAVDGHMRTSVSGIYAAGDCTESLDVSSGQIKPLANLPNAAIQGYTAGANMAGGDEVFDTAVMMNSIGFFGLHCMTAGTYEGDMYEEKTDSSVKRLFTKDDRLKGFVLIGCEDRAGIYTSMIRNCTPVSSVDFETMKKAAAMTAFSKDIRKKVLGGIQ